ncbi:MAG: hypothetical protein JW740_00105 [Candidatus Zambryskibacteria bacterium]|nr:hypothetical protein [Candidatus Zambryskibacteria bacterium]
MKKTTIGLLTLAFVLGAISTIAGTSLAYRGDPGVPGPDCSPERHEAMEKAFENNDYNAWKELMGNRGRVTEIINQSNFAQFAEARKFAKQGNLENANAIRKELGLGMGDKSGNGQYRINRSIND